MTTTKVVACISVCTFVFGVGVAVGQRIQPSRFDAYLATTPKNIDLAVVAANVGILRDLITDHEYSTGIEAPTLVYDAKRKKLVATAVVNSNLGRLPLEKVKEALSRSWAKTIVSARDGFGNIADDEFEMSFTERHINGATITFTDFAEFKKELVLK